MDVAGGDARKELPIIASCPGIVNPWAFCFSTISAINSIFVKIKIHDTNN